MEADSQIDLTKNSIKILNLKINVGHQRAIAVGLQYVFNEVVEYDFLVVLDSDGEDKPEDIPSLIEKAKKQNNKKIIFTQRNKRQESSLFKTGYFFYKYLFCFLTGQKINFGNFSVIPKKLLGQVVCQQNIWNHYSGCIIQSKIPFDKILLDRGKRYKGTSKMNFNSLILHGLSSISVYFDFLSPSYFKSLFIWYFSMCNCCNVYFISKNIYRQCNSWLGVKFNSNYLRNYSTVIFGNFNCTFITIEFEKKYYKSKFKNL